MLNKKVYLFSAPILIVILTVVSMNIKEVLFPSHNSGLFFDPSVLLAPFFLLAYQILLTLAGYKLLNETKPGQLLFLFLVNFFGSIALLFAYFIVIIAIYLKFNIVI